jgi:hypothetical protein
MPDRRDDRQLHLSLRIRPDAKLGKRDGVTKDQPAVTDLNRVRALRHGTTVLERVIREGFTKKK